MENIVGSGDRESSEPKEELAVRWEVSWTRERE